MHFMCVIYDINHSTFIPAVFALCTLANHILDYNLQRQFHMYSVYFCFSKY